MQACIGMTVLIRLRFMSLAPAEWQQVTTSSLAHAITWQMIVPQKHGQTNLIQKKYKSLHSKICGNSLHGQKHVRACPRF